MRHTSLRQLQIFEAVARHRSFSKAAAELHLTQPAVSMQVRLLEDGAGLPLTEQIGKQIHLTEAGQEIALRARAIARELSEAQETLAALRGVQSGHFTLGVVSTAKYFAPHLLVAYQRLQPGVLPRLEVHNREEIVRRLSENEIDLAIMGRPPQDFNTVADAFANHPLIFLAAPSHPLAQQRRINAELLSGETFLVREPGSGTRTAMEGFFAEQGITPGAQLAMTSNDTIKQAAIAGMGVAFLSAHAVSLELEMGRLVRLKVDGTPVMRQWFAVRRADKRLLPAAVAFWNYLLKAGPATIAAAAG